MWNESTDSKIWDSFATIWIVIHAGLSLKAKSNNIPKIIKILSVQSKKELSDMCICALDKKFIEFNDDRY